MTALEQFVRLEAIGLWRGAADTPPREVVVALGNATLILRDMNDNPLGHWALTATRVFARSETGVTYVTEADAAETLAISDFEMIRAIEMIGAGRHAVGRRRRHLPRWLRFALPLALVAAVVWWGPDWLRRYAASSIPGGQSEQIGTAMLAEIAAAQGGTCHNPNGVAAAARLIAQLFPDDSQWQLHVLPMQDRPTASLPGGHILVNAALLAQLREPDELAGYVALEAARASAGAPLTSMLRDAGLAVSFRLMLRGQLGPDVARETATRILAETDLPELRYDGAALNLLTRAGISAGPFASALTRTGVDYARASGFAVAMPDGARAALADQDWVALQDICEG